MASNFEIRFAPQVSRALKQRRPIVALESTVLAHGLPFPLNLQTARECEEAVSAQGAIPATIAIIDGTPMIGLDNNQLQLLASGLSPSGLPIEKVGLNNLAGVSSKQRWGATTAASTLHIARAAGIQVFSTGGIGGIHRRVIESFDISADLTALARVPLIAVCAGAKAILDLPKTVEHLETLGVPIIGFETDEFPAFYSRTSGLPVDITVNSADEAARLAIRHWSLGLETAVLICAPIPKESELPAAEVERLIDEAIEMAGRAGVRGKALTPFLLSQLENLSMGRTLEANRALLLNNARIAARIASNLPD